MGGDSEYEPKDSRNITGTAHTPDGHFTGDPQKAGHGGEYEPRDSRNVTGTAATPDGRWTNKDGKPPAGVPENEPPTAEDVASNSHAGKQDDTLEEEPEREPLEPGFNIDGQGDVGASRASTAGNSNT